MLHKKLFRAITTKIQKKTKIGTKPPKSDKHMYNLRKQNYIEPERGVEYRNYQRKVAIVTDFGQKDGEKIEKQKNL